MLKISKLTDYAIVVLSHLARHPVGWHVATGIADATGIALPTVSKVLKQLARVGILSSARGVQGGYRLARPAEQVTVACIISALEGPIALTECSLSDETCEQTSSCGIHGNWYRINQAVQAALEAVTLADMLAPSVTTPVEVRIPVHTIASARRR